MIRFDLTGRAATLTTSQPGELMVCFHAWVNGFACRVWQNCMLSRNPLCTSSSKILKKLGLGERGRTIWEEDGGKWQKVENEGVSKKGHSFFS
jgi:hypothetical protein